MTKIEVYNYNNYKVIELAGDFVGVEEVDELREKFKEVGSEDNLNLIVDLKKVNYLNSTSLGAFLSANALLEKGNGKMLLCNASDYIANIFSITKLTLIFPIYSSLDEAIASL
jgi:anti-sigma B factor antagonist